MARTSRDLTAFDGIISTTMAKVIWVGTIEISYLDHEDSDKRKKAFTVVTTWAFFTLLRRGSELQLAQLRRVRGQE